MHLTVKMTSEQSQPLLHPQASQSRHTDSTNSETIPLSRSKRQTRSSRQPFNQRVVSLRSDCSGGYVQVRPTRHSRHEIAATPSGHPQTKGKYGKASHMKQTLNHRFICNLWNCFCSISCYEVGSARSSRYCDNHEQQNEGVPLLLARRQTCSEGKQLPVVQPHRMSSAGLKSCHSLMYCT